MAQSKPYIENQRQHLKCSNKLLSFFVQYGENFTLKLANTFQRISTAKDKTKKYE